MFELISYCVVGACLLWDIVLVIILMVESANDVAELDRICHQHAKKEW